MIRNFLILTSSFALLSACGDDAANTSSNVKVFSSASNAVTSMYSGSAGTILPASMSSITCSSGSPTSSSAGDATFAGEQVYCTLNTNSKSPDTVQGSYFLVSNVLCAIEKQTSLTYAATATETNNLTLLETDSCFGDAGFDIDGNGNLNGSFDIAIQDKALSSGDYDFFVGIQLGSTTYDTSAEPSVRFYLKDSDGILSARIYQESDQSYVEFVINTNNNSFYYENVDYGNERHIRLAANGTFSGDSGTFTSVSDAKFIQSDGNTSAGRSVMMLFDGTNDSYDHHINNSRDGDYSAIAGLSYNSAFLTWSGAITDMDPEADPLLELSTFDMSF
ncbi:MAG: hypothetical protein AB8E15_13400 [Bdellovibrionales bacterium]